MAQQVSDTIQVLATDTIQDTIRQTDYSIGHILPLERETRRFPHNIFTTDRSMQKTYSLNREEGTTFAPAPLSYDTCFWILSVSLVLLAFLTTFGRRGIAGGFAIFNFRSRRKTRSVSSSDIIAWPALLRLFYSIVNLSLFLTVAAVLTGMLGPLPGPSTLKFIALAAGIFTGATLLRHLICILVAAFSGQKDLFVEYVEVIYSGWYVSSLFAFLISTLALFTPLHELPGLLWAGIGLIGMLFLLRYIRLLNIFLKRRVPLLYFILYLCALEVLPVLVVFKILGVF